jgi:hypothetical protein
MALRRGMDDAGKPGAMLLAATHSLPKRDMIDK